MEDEAAPLVAPLLPLASVLGPNEEVLAAATRDVAAAAEVEAVAVAEAVLAATVVAEAEEAPAAGLRRSSLPARPRSLISESRR